MKFNSIAKQNQRIEKITMKHLVVGIDIAKEVHVARAVNYRGIEQGRSLAFTNNSYGFERLIQWITSLQRNQKLSRVIVGMEPTGHYWLSLAYWLIEQQIEVVVVQTKTISRTKEYRDNSPTKNDKKDALLIADTIKNGYYTELRIPQGNYAELREIMTARDTWVAHLTRIKNQIHRWLSVRFPEYYQIFKDPFGVSSLITLKHFPTPLEIRKLQPEDIILVWKQHTKRHAGKVYANSLLQYARKSIGTTEGIHAARLNLTFLLEQYEHTQNLLESLEEQAEVLMEHDEVAQIWSSIPGLGNKMIAGILAETGDPRGFIHGNQILRLAGLHLGEQSSGKHKGQVSITKRGRSRLRKMLFIAVRSLISTNKEIGRMWKRKK